MSDSPKIINFKIITPERTLFSEEVSQVTLQTTQGEITVMPGHIPIITNLMPGELYFVKNQEIVPMVVLGGFAEITKNSVTVLADAAEKVEEIMEERAKEAREKAEELRLQKITDRKEYTALTAQIEREMARLRVSQKYRRQKKSHT